MIKSIKPAIRAVIHVLLAISPMVAMAQEEAVISLQSTVTGNQEQPNVMHIVPWQPPTGAQSMYRPLESLVDELFQPVERDEFIREITLRNLVGGVSTDTE